MQTTYRIINSLIGTGVGTHYHVVYGCVGYHGCHRHHLRQQEVVAIVLRVNLLQEEQEGHDEDGSAEMDVTYGSLKFTFRTSKNGDFCFLGCTGIVQFVF